MMIERTILIVKGILLGIGYAFTFEITTANREWLGMILMSIVLVMNLIGL